MYWVIVRTTIQNTYCAYCALLSRILICQSTFRYLHVVYPIGKANYFLKNFFKIFYFFIWERQRMSGEKGRGRGKGISRLPTECRAQCRAIRLHPRALRTWPKLNQMLNWLSHPGTPGMQVTFNRNSFIETQGSSSPHYSGTDHSIPVAMGFFLYLLPTKF